MVFELVRVGRPGIYRLSAEHQELSIPDPRICQRSEFTVRHDVTKDKMNDLSKREIHKSRTVTLETSGFVFFTSDTALPVSTHR